MFLLLHSLKKVHFVVTVNVLSFLTVSVCVLFLFVCFFQCDNGECSQV